MHMQRDLARLGAEHHTRGLDKITQVKHLVEKIHAFFAQLIGAEEQLYLAAHIFDMSK